MTYAVMPTARRRSLLSQHVALGAADIALRRKSGVDAAIKHYAVHFQS